jgi:hypothetical protein
MFSLQIEHHSTRRRGPKKLEKRIRLLCLFGRAIENFGRYDNDRLAVLFDHPLRAFRTHKAEQLAKARFRLVKLPDVVFLHADRLL